MGSSASTDYLFATPSAITGVGSIFNLSGGYFAYNLSRSGEEADLEAIRRDWLVTAQDLKKAVKLSKSEVVCEQK